MAAVGSSEFLMTVLYMGIARSTTRLRRLRGQVENGLELAGKTGKYAIASPPIYQS
jgi:hypothetical protein